MTVKKKVNYILHSVRPVFSQAMSTFRSFFKFSDIMGSHVCSLSYAGPGAAGWLPDGANVVFTDTDEERVNCEVSLITGD